MAKTFSQKEYEDNKGKYELIIHTLQKENLTLSNKQLKRYWIYSTLSFFAGIVSAIVVHICTKDTGDIAKTKQRITALEQTVSILADSAQNVKVYRTNGKDTIILR